MVTQDTSLLRRVLPGSLIFLAMVAAYALGVGSVKSGAAKVQAATPRVIYRTPDPTAQHTTAGAIAADRARWAREVALDRQAGVRYPTWMLGYRVEGVTQTHASIDNYLARVWVGGTTLRFTAETINLRWNGQRWVYESLPLVEALGSRPTAYAQFTPLP